jgi:ferredoxin-fold anticodon binding domain-containing protein
MSQENTDQAKINQPPTFIKLCKTAFVKKLVKEARRVKYLVEQDEMSVVVRDDADNALVFKAIQVRSNMWATTFSTLYWQQDA